MSDSEVYEEVTLRADGVTVTKRFEEDEFPVPAIAFEFVSGREEPVRVRLSDEVPDGVAVEDLGFHPEYGSEYWEIDEDTITFERELEAGSEYTSVYGIRATGTEDISQFLTEPVIEEVDPPLSNEQAPTMTNDGGDVIPDNDDVVKDVIAGEGEIPGLEDEGQEGTEDEDVEKLDLTDPTAPEGESADTADTEATPTDVEGSLISTMAEEIRSGNVSVEDLQLVQRAFEHVAENGSGSTDARIKQLQSDIADLRAYTGALEEFLDEQGTGQQLIDEFESELKTLDDRLDRMESDLESNATTIEDMEGTVEGVREEVDGVTADVDDMQSEIESVGSTLEDVEASVADLEDVESTVDDLEDAVGDLRSTVEDLEDEITDGDVVERIGDMESEIEDLRDWQDQIKQTFGGG